MYSEQLFQEICDSNNDDLRGMVMDDMCAKGIPEWEAQDMVDNMRTRAEVQEYLLECCVFWENAEKAQQNK
jgi:hypothetical protein